MEKIGIVAFAFGAPRTISSNKVIAKIALEKALMFQAPVYTQYDVPVESEDVEVEYIKEEAGKPPPTLRIARGAVRWAKRKDLAELYVIAAKPHLWRALRDVREVVREKRARINVFYCLDESYRDNFWFCSDSEQKRTRSPHDWWKREEILKRMPLFLYKLVAS